MFEYFMGVIGLLYLLFRIKRNNFTKKIDHFPGPKSYPLFGNLLELNFEPDAMFSLARKYAEKYKKTYRIWAAHIGSVNIITPEDTEVILSSPTEIKKCFIYKFMHPWIGTGILTSEGKKWHQRRKILTPAFHFTILKRFVEIFNEHGVKLITHLKEESQNPKSNVVSLMYQCTLNIICETAMGINMDSNGTRESRYIQAVHEMGKMIYQRFMNLLYYNKYVFNSCPIGWRQRKIVKILHDFTDRVIREKQENYQVKDVNDFEPMDEELNRKTRLALLDLLIDAKNNKGLIDDMGIREEVDTFMLEGHETVALAMSYILMALANHKEIQDKIFEELGNIFESPKRQPTYKDLQNMKYLEMCLKESLRLYPVAPFISRELTEDLMLSNGIVPSGCVVNIHIYDIHRDPKVFPEPEKFDPDRFLPENIKGRHPFSYVPFSAGPRNCLGQKFAMLELKSLVSSILRNFKLEAVTKTKDLQFVVDIGLQNKDAIYVKFIERINKI